MVRCSCPCHPASALRSYRARARCRGPWAIEGKSSRRRSSAMFPSTPVREHHWQMQLWKVSQATAPVNRLQKHARWRGERSGARLVGAFGERPTAAATTMMFAAGRPKLTPGKKASHSGLRLRSTKRLDAPNLRACTGDSCVGTANRKVAGARAGVGPAAPAPREPLARQRATPRPPCLSACQHHCQLPAQRATWIVVVSRL